MLLFNTTPLQRSTTSLTNQEIFQVITGAGHHVFADKPELFNRFVNEACALSDSNTLTPTASSGTEPEDDTTVDAEDNSSAETNRPATNNIVNDKNFVKTST